MKQTPSSKSRRKILVSVWTPLLGRVNEVAESVFLKRDAFLDTVLRSEAALIEFEIPSPGNSDLARAFLENQLKTLVLTPVSLNLSAETIEAINAACKSRNIPRDCFINRTLLFLCGGRDDLWQPLLPDVNWDDYFEELRREGEGGVDPFEIVAAQQWGVLHAIADTFEKNPFWLIRAALELARRDTRDGTLFLHRAIVPTDFLRSPKGKHWQYKGLNCYLPDDEVENSATQAATRAAHAEVFRQLMSTPRKSK
ncbi:MAG: hypothetical protein NDI67_07255 [Sulfuritalea sp.]|nr:hypothetical protein [Sulfuritalea sp.]